MARASKYGDKREELLALIAEPVTTHGKAPTIRDLASRLEVGVGTIHAYLQRLAEEGVIEWKPGKHRSLKVTPKGFQELSL
jgi:Mn-dependent DtxR family transcriptional regulator